MIDILLSWEVETGMPYSSGAQYQQRYGIDNIFASLQKTGGAKAVGREILKSGGHLSEALQGETSKICYKERKRSGVQFAAKICHVFVTDR